MKRYIVAAKKTLKVGDYVHIRGNGWYAGEWGVIKYIDEEDDEYHVAISNGNESPVFSKDELERMKHRPEGV